MSVGYAKTFNPNKTSQSEKIREDQVKNSAGGYTWLVDDWTRLQRFLILGAEGNSYYASQSTLVKENAQAVIRLIKNSGTEVVAQTLEVSEAGRSYKNDAALFVLALCFSEGDNATKTAARSALPRIARIGTHLFTFVEYANSLRGWGDSLKHAVQDWYNEKEGMAAAYDLTKYRSRGGWSHRDVLRLCHAKTSNSDKNLTYRYAVGKVTEGKQYKEFQDKNLASYLSAIEDMKLANADEASQLIRDFNFPREVVPTELLTQLQVWEALFERMPLTAMIRNLATMTRIGLLKPFAKANAIVAERLSSNEILRKARIHPLQILGALLTYSAGHSARGSNTWTPVPQIVDALDKAFYLSFESVIPTNKRTLLALDVSGSMGCGEVGGIPGLSPRKASAALALVTASTEDNHAFVSFSSGSGRTQWGGNYGVAIKPLNISPHQRLDDVISTISNLPFGGTDCALPMIYALENKLEVDAFVILTDSETWAGNIHPVQALREYRNKMRIPNAKLIVVGMVSNSFSIADPTDPGMLDIVGFSTDTPSLIADFIRE